MAPPTRAHGGRSRRRGPRQQVVGAVAFVAVLASVVAAFNDDARLLKLALVAVLWVAVGALILLEQARRRADTAVARTADLRVIYELELEREVRTRHEHELVTELAIHERVSAAVRSESRNELDELRVELKALRESLSLLLSGDLLVERVALRAEATRLRSLTDNDRLDGSAAGVPWPAAAGFDPLEVETVEHAPEPVHVPSEPVHAAPPAPVFVVAEPVVAAETTFPWLLVPPVAAAPELGAHRAGRSVSDLIAAYGGDPSGGNPPSGHRRRRAAD